MQFTLIMVRDQARVVCSCFMAALLPGMWNILWHVPVTLISLINRCNFLLLPWKIAGNCEQSASCRRQPTAILKPAMSSTSCTYLKFSLFQWSNSWIITSVCIYAERFANNAINLRWAILWTSDVHRLTKKKDLKNLIPSRCQLPVLCSSTEQGSTLRLIRSHLRLNFSFLRLEKREYSQICD